MLDVMMPLASDLLQHAAHPIQSPAHLSLLAPTPIPTLPTGVPDPGRGIAPPGADKALIILKWFVWGVYGACVLGFATIAGNMALKHRRGEGGSHLSSVVMVLFACILAASGPALINNILDN